jgi:hypothetical protein
MNRPMKEIESGKSPLGQITASLFSNAAAKWLTIALAIALLVLVFRLKDFRYKDRQFEFDRPPPASASLIAARMCDWSNSMIMPVAAGLVDLVRERPRLAAALGILAPGSDALRSKMGADPAAPIGAASEGAEPARGEIERAARALPTAFLGGFAEGPG